MKSLDDNSITFPRKFRYERHRTERAHPYPSGLPRSPSYCKFHHNELHRTERTAWNRNGWVSGEWVRKSIEHNSVSFPSLCGDVVTWWNRYSRRASSLPFFLRSPPLTAEFGYESIEQKHHRISVAFWKLLHEMHRSQQHQNHGISMKYDLPPDLPPSLEFVAQSHGSMQSDISHAFKWPSLRFHGVRSPVPHLGKT